MIKVIKERDKFMKNTLGGNIKELREAKNLTQRELAKILKVANSTLSQYESNIRIPSDDVKVQIADFFNVSIDYLLGRPFDADKNKDVPKSKAFQLEEEFPEGVSMLYRANEELTAEQKEIMLRLINNVFFDDKNKK